MIKVADTLFADYYDGWVDTYKDGAVRDITLRKYKLASSWVRKLAPDLMTADITRTELQRIINDYAKEHEKTTTMDFYHQVKGAIIDAVDEGLIDRDPTRRIVIKGKAESKKKPKYLSQFELQKLVADLNLSEKINWDWLILLIAKTGMRFSEALAVTPDDFDFKKQTLTINKTWDYKTGTGFEKTKNKSSVRTIRLDWQIVTQFSELVKQVEHDRPLFVGEKTIYNSTINNILERHCKRAGVPNISIHGLRHTHASLLLLGGVSIASVSQRLGHSSMATTQKVYLHIVRELENQDVDLMMRELSTIG